MSALTEDHPSTADFEQPSIFTTRESQVRSYSRGWPAVFDKAEGSWVVETVTGNYGHNHELAPAH